MSIFNCSRFSSSVRGGIVGGQYLFTLGAVPPYSIGRCDLKIKSSNSEGFDSLQKTCLATTLGSKNFYKNLAIAFYIIVKLTTTVLFVFCIQFDESSFAAALNIFTGSFFTEK